jgi:MFS family permease
MIGKSVFTDTFIRPLILCCLVTFACYLGTSMRFPLVPLYARSLGISTVAIGLISSAYFFFAGLFSFPLGMLSDRRGRKPVAAAGLLLLSAATLLLCVGRTSVELMAVYLLLGLGMAAFGPTMMSYLAEVSPRTHLGRSYGWYTTALFAGMSVGPATGGMLAQQFGFKPVFVLSAVCLLLTLVVLIVLLPAAPANPAGLEPAGQGNFRALWQNRPYIGCLLVTLGGAFSSGLFFTFVPLLAKARGLSIRQIGVIFLVQALCNALSRIPMGYFSDKAGRRNRFVIAGGLCTALSIFGFGAAHSMAHFVTAAGALGISMGLAFTSVGALIAECVPPFMRGLGMGGYNTGIYFGMMISSGVMGSVIQTVNFRSAFASTAIVTACLTGCFAWLARNYTPGERRHGP